MQLAVDDPLYTVHEGGVFRAYLVDALAGAAAPTPDRAPRPPSEGN